MYFLFQQKVTQQNKTNIILTMNLLLLVSFISIVSCNIYDPPNYLYTKRCWVGNITAANSFTCTASTPQSNIISAGIVLADWYNQPIGTSARQFKAELSAYGTAATTFTIVVSQVVNGLRQVAFFLIVVKTQASPQFDIMNFVFGNAVIGTGTGTRTISSAILVPGNSIFTSAMVADLQFKTFLTSYKATPNTTTNKIKIQSSGVISGFSIIVYAKAYDGTLVTALRGVLVAMLWASAKYSGLPILISGSVNLATDWNLKNYGPDYDGKCIFGVVHINYAVNSINRWSFYFNQFNHYYRFEGTSSATSVEYLCLQGTKTGCADDQVYSDFASSNCYRASQCPLPVPSVTAWSSNTLCPPCIQLICTTCLATNRSDCQTCGPNSHIESGICVCDTGLIPVTSYISPTIQPAWGGTVFSLQRCSINCTNYIPNCQQTSCTSQTYCTGCKTSYVAKNIDATNQNCKLCSQLWTNCVSCTSQMTCDTCGSGYYLLAPGCDQCKNAMDRCLTCTNDGLTCNSCQPGFNPMTNFCQCIPSYHSLTACLDCNINIECTSCDSANGYYLKGTVCDLCSNPMKRCLTCTHDGVTCNSCEPGFNVVSVIGCECIPSYHSIANCLTCNLDIECTSCVTGYYVLGVACDLCSNPLSHCQQCTSSTVCIKCESGYYIKGTVCDLCSNSMRRCLTCTSDGTTCNSCEAGFNAVSGVGCQCIPSFHSIANCITCNLGIECTSCAVGFYVQGIVCDTCSNPLAHCLVCTSSSVCTSCDIGYYVNGNVCDSCSNPMLGCLECSSNSVCTRCDSGFDLISNKCRCNPNFHPLAFCATCTILTACDTCVSNSYFVASADKLCHPCNNIHPQCLTCSSQNTCTSCSVTWMLVTYGNGSTLCTPCVPSTPNCTTCSPNPTTCVNCDFLFGVNSSAQCQRCNTLLGIPYCESCQDNTVCLSCLSQNVLIAGNCQFCKDLVLLCKECVYVPAANKVNCTQCYDNYYATLNPLTGYNQCKKCLNLFKFCNTCNSSNCFSCVSPYVLGSTGLCDQCITGYFYMSGFCTNINGCQSSVISPTGVATCIACITELHFTYDSVLKKCVCLPGFKQIFQINALSRCQPICGDGIFLNGVEQCDDNNTKNNDGCDEHCKIESGFECSTQEPTKCVLHFNFNYFIFNYATRQIGQNTVKLSYFVWPAHAGLIGANWKTMLKFNFTQTAVDPNSIQFSYSLQTGQLIVLAPYKESLEDVGLQSLITFDKNVIVSDPSTISFTTTLKGSTSPLIYEPDAMVQTAKNIGTMSLVLVILLLLQFYLGSYVHKMIGLETIQVIQSIYFARMIAKSPPTSILSSMNVMDYSASGYENSEILFGNLGQIKDQFDSLQDSQFLQIGMEKFFLQNVNLSMVPVFIGVVVYLVSLCRKFSSRNKVMQFKQQEEKDNYTRLKRSSQWVYDHSVFPLVMMFNQISFYFTVSQLSSSKATLPEPTLFQNIEISSFAVHLVILFMTTGLYVYEIFNSYFQYKKFSMTDEEKAKVVQSAIELLQHDTNNPDRANYHPIYVLVYMLYYLCLEMVIVSTIFFPQFKFMLQCTIGVSGVYFLLICFWPPYHKSANVHNHLLKLYYGTFVAFLVIQYLLTKNLGIPLSTYALLMYIIMGLLGAILAAGFGRIYLQYRFRKQLDNDDGLLEWKQQKTQSKNEQLESKKDKKQLLNKKRLALFENNSYLFQNQVNQLRGRLNKKINSTFKQPTQNKAKLQQSQNEDFFIKKLRDQINQNRQHIIFQNQLKDYHKKYNKKQKPTKQHLIQQQSKQGQQCLQEEQQGITNQQFIKKKDDLSTLENIKNKLRAEWITLDD